MMHAVSHDGLMPLSISSLPLPNSPIDTNRRLPTHLVCTMQKMKERCERDNDAVNAYGGRVSSAEEVTSATKRTCQILQEQWPQLEPMDLEALQQQMTGPELAEHLTRYAVALVGPGGILFSGDLAHQAYTPSEF